MTTKKPTQLEPIDMNQAITDANEIAGILHELNRIQKFQVPKIFYLQFESGPAKPAEKVECNVYARRHYAIAHKVFGNAIDDALHEYRHSLIVRLRELGYPRWGELLDNLQADPENVRN